MQVEMQGLTKHFGATKAVNDFPTHYTMGTVVLLGPSGWEKCSA